MARRHHAVGLRRARRWAGPSRGLAGLPEPLSSRLGSSVTALSLSSPNAGYCCAHSHAVEMQAGRQTGSVRLVRGAHTTGFRDSAVRHKVYSVLRSGLWSFAPDVPLRTARFAPSNSFGAAFSGSATDSGSCAFASLASACFTSAILPRMSSPFSIGKSTAAASSVAHLSWPKRLLAISVTLDAVSRSTVSITRLTRRLQVFVTGRTPRLSLHQVGKRGTG